MFSFVFFPGVKVALGLFVFLFVSDVDDVDFSFQINTDELLLYAILTIFVPFTKSVSLEWWKS